MHGNQSVAPTHHNQRTPVHKSKNPAQPKIKRKEKKKPAPKMAHHQAPPLRVTSSLGTPISHTHTLGTARTPPRSLLGLRSFAQAVMSSWDGISSTIASLAPIHPLRQHCHLQVAFPDTPSRIMCLFWAPSTLLHHHMCHTGLSCPFSSRLLP